MCRCTHSVDSLRETKYVCFHSLLSYARAYSRPLSFPTTLEDLRTLAEQLHSLKQEHFYRVLGLFSLAYLYKQTFAIPGSLFLVSTNHCAQHTHTLHLHSTLHAQHTLQQKRVSRMANEICALCGLYPGLPIFGCLDGCHQSLPTVLYTMFLVAA